jgi:hypothetical protein
MKMFIPYIAIDRMNNIEYISKSAMEKTFVTLPVVYCA